MVFPVSVAAGLVLASAFAVGAEQIPSPPAPNAQAVVERAESSLPASPVQAPASKRPAPRVERRGEREVMFQFLLELYRTRAAGGGSGR